MKWEKFIEAAKLDPARYYRDPADVVRDRRLSNEERLAILTAWERDARALAVADDENMSGGEQGHLSQVIRARMEVEKNLSGNSTSNEAGGNGK